MSTIADLFEVGCTRRFDVSDKTSIAELAQFTHVETEGTFHIASAYDQLREEWKFEIDEDSIFYYVGFDSARAAFCDGSTLHFKRKK